jgi:hypothetical protein
MIPLKTQKFIILEYRKAPHNPNATFAFKLMGPAKVHFLTLIDFNACLLGILTLKC